MSLLNGVNSLKVNQILLKFIIILLLYMGMIYVLLIKE